MIEIRADLRATVWRVQTTVGATVKAGDEVMILESMKTEIPVESPSDGSVVSVHVEEGDSVEVGDVVAVIDPA